MAKGEKSKGEQDKFGREKYASFIENLILNSNDYKRDIDHSSYVMAIDSSWGTGKTFLLDMLEEKLNNDKNISFIRYNAWENDFWDNAFEPLAYNILNCELVKDCIQLDNTTNSLRENIVKSALIVSRGFAEKSLERFIGTKAIEELSRIAKESLNISKELINGDINVFPEYKSFKDALNDLKTSLGKCVNKNELSDKKLVVIIDELDRCKPTFAINTLEIVKHIFNIENVVFVFALDVQQLSHSIKCVYGQEMDSVGYLTRFFDYMSKIPTPDVYIYTEHILDEILNKYTTHSSKLSELSIYFKDIYDDMKLSIRDLNTILNSYNVMLGYFLNEYETIEAHKMYIFFLALKYKCPKVFNDVFINKNNINLIPKYLTNVTKTFQELEIGKDLTSGIPPPHGKIKNLEYSYKTNGYVTDVKCDNMTITGDKMMFNGNIRTYPIDGKFSMGNVLFYPDFQKWEEIKNYSFNEYIHQQLEMCYFIQPEELE